MSKPQIGILVGSARKGAYSRAVAEAIAANLSASVDAKILQIDDLQMFNQDYDDEGTTPASWTRFRSEVAACTGYIFVTPEHNRSIPALLKNALDIASRPWGQSVWGPKPGAVVSVSPSQFGGMSANVALKQVLSFLDVTFMGQPEIYVGNVANSLDENGKPNEGLAAYLKTLTDAFVEYIKLFD